MPLMEFLQNLYKSQDMDPNTFLNSNFDTFERILEPSFIDMPRQGLDDVIDRVWMDICCEGNRKPIHFVQGSFGLGKTYALRELARPSQSQ